MGASPSLGGRRVVLRLRQSFLSCFLFSFFFQQGIKEVLSRHLSFHRSARAVTSGVDLRFGFLVQKRFELKGSADSTLVLFLCVVRLVCLVVARGLLCGSKVVCL